MTQELIFESWSNGKIADAVSEIITKNYDVLKLDNSSRIELKIDIPQFIKAQYKNTILSSAYTKAYIDTVINQKAEEKAKEKTDYTLEQCKTLTSFEYQSFIQNLNTRQFLPKISFEYRPESLEIEPYLELDHTVVFPEVMAHYQFATIADQNESVYYYDTGIYRPDGKQKIKDICQKLVKNCNTRLVSEVIEAIRRQTYINPKLIFENRKICTQNGILDPHTFELSPLSPQHYNTSLLPFTVDYTATNLKLWNAIKEKIDSKDYPIILEILWSLIAWTNQFKKMYVFLGKSNTGKTTLANDIITGLIIGHSNISHEKATKYLDDEHRFATSRFVGKRGNISEEIGNLTLANLETQKGLVGGAVQDTELKGSNAIIQFEPKNFTFILATNELGDIYKTIHDTSIITRLQFLRFTHEIERQNGHWLDSFFANDHDKQTAISTVISIVLKYKKGQLLGKIKPTQFSTIEETKRILREVMTPEQKFFANNIIQHKFGIRTELTQVRERFEKFVGYELQSNQEMGYILKDNKFTTERANSKTWVIDAILNESEILN